MSRIKDTIQKFKEAKKRFDALSEQEQQALLNDKELDLDTVNSSSKIYTEEEEQKNDPQ